MHLSRAENEDSTIIVLPAPFTRMLVGLETMLAVFVSTRYLLNRELLSHTRTQEWLEASNSRLCQPCMLSLPYLAPTWTSLPGSFLSCSAIVADLYESGHVRILKLRLQFLRAKRLAEELHQVFSVFWKSHRRAKDRVIKM